MNELLSQVWAAALPGIATALAAVVVSLLMALKRWIDSRISDDRHWRAASIVADAVIVAMQRLGPDVAKALADGKISEDELKTLREAAMGLAKKRLSDLRGFASDRVGEWLQHQVDVALGNLQARLTGHREIGPDDEAN